jgi:hypothetical protein
MVSFSAIACSSDSAEESYGEGGRAWLTRWAGLGVAGAMIAYEAEQWDEMMSQLYALDMLRPLSELPAEAGSAVLLAGWRPLEPPKLEHLAVALQIYHDARVLADPIEEEMWERFGERPPYRWDCKFYGSFKYERVCNLLLAAERNLTTAQIEWESSITGELPLWD